MPGEAMRMKLELSRYRRTPDPFTPPPLLAPVDHDVIVEGYASPADVIDREFTRFPAYCWMPLPKEIPLLYRHLSGQPAGKILEAHSTNKGLYVKALVTHPDAKRCSHFSVAATIHGYSIRYPEDHARAYALVTCCSLDEVSIVQSPANPAAKILHRSRPPPALTTIDLGIAGIRKCMEIVECLQVINREQPTAPRPRLVSIQCSAPVIYGKVPPRPSKPRSEFGKLADALGRMEA
jgi:hypothetical protein